MKHKKPLEDSPQTQAIYVRNHLLNNGSITQAEAFRMYGIACLAERIRDLRQTHGAGAIKTTMVTGKHKTTSRPMRYAMYTPTDRLRGA